MSDALTHLTHPDALSIEGDNPRVRARAYRGIYRENASGASGASGGKTLADLARRVARLGPDHRDPERYHLEKSEIVAELRRMAREASR